MTATHKELCYDSTENLWELQGRRMEDMVGYLLEQLQNSIVMEKLGSFTVYITCDFEECRHLKTLLTQRLPNLKLNLIRRHDSHVIVSYCELR